MKKTLSLILVLLLCLSLCACGGTTNTPAGTIIMRYGELALNAEQIGQILEAIPLTVDNWRTYLQTYTYEETVQVKDAFGEVAESWTEQYYYLGGDVSRYHSFSADAAIELRNKATGELKTYYLSSTWCARTPEEAADMDIVQNLDDYECTRIIGHLFYIDIPQEVLFTDEDNPMLTRFWIASEKVSTTCSIDHNTNELHRPLDEILETLGLDIYSVTGTWVP